MLRYLFASVLIVHGLIHLMGFAKAFGYGRIKQFTTTISKPAGLLWLTACLILLAAAVLLLLKKDPAFILVLFGVIASQALILTSWKTAGFGSIINIIILLAAMPSYANNRFNKMAATESRTILARVAGENKVIVTKEMLAHLPPVVQQWLTLSGIVGKEKTTTIRLKQKGVLRTGPLSKWMPFETREYFSVTEPAFVWTTKVQMMPWVNLSGRDKFECGHGEMVIKLFSLWNIAYAANDAKTDTAAMLRYLAETSWFPAAALSDYIKWEPIDATSAKATMTFDGISVSGIFTFTKNGDMQSFSADRYYGTGKNATLESWLVQSEAWREFHGIRVASKSTLTWKLKTGDFHWATIELTDMDFNNTEIYK
jgi:hypothetical protein